MRKVHVGVVVLALLATVGAVTLVFQGPEESHVVPGTVLNLVVVWSFIVTGLVAWIRRPDNRFGVLMTAVGLTWLLGALQETNYRYLFAAGVVVGLLWLGVFVHAMLAFPRGYLETRLVWATVLIGYAVVLLAPLSVALVEEDLCDGCPENLLAVTDSRPALTGVAVVAGLAGLFVAGSAGYVLLRRWRAASEPLRRMLAPVFGTTAASLILLVLSSAVTPLSEDAGFVLYWILLGVIATVPLSFLAGLTRSRLARAGVSRLVVELGQTRAPGRLRDALRRALGDHTLEVAYWIPESEGFADLRGRPLRLPGEGEERVATLVERDGNRVGALVHDPILSEDPSLVSAVVAAAGLALENEQRLAALLQTEERHRALLDAIPDLMFRIGADGTYLDWEGDPADLVAPPDELLGARLADVLPADVAATLMALVGAALATGSAEPVEYTLDIGGESRDFEARASVSGEEEVVLIVRDVTERNRLHLDLQRERDFIRTVVDSAPSFFSIVDPKGHLVRFNRTLEQASGITDGESVRGRLFWEVFLPPGPDREAVRRQFLELVAAGCEGENESRWETTAGEELIVAWRLTPLTDETGRPRFLVSGTDVTQRRHQEEELRRSRARLVEIGDVERRRLERNLHDGAQQRLVSLSLMLRLAESRLETDAAGARELLATASTELAQALEELRELARGIHPAVLSDRGLTAALETLATRSQLPVVLATPAERLPASVEAVAYYVVSEALANIAKYAQASAVDVRVERVNGRAVVEVADDGVGGADPTRGSGLRGLADRVEALDGLLRVESEPGTGTTVRAEIPCG